MNHESNRSSEPSRRRKTRARATKESDEEELLSLPTTLGSRKRVQGIYVDTLGHLIIEDVEDSERLLSILDRGDPSHLRLLEIHLDASKSDEYADSQLAMVLNALHPRDGTNPHRLQAIRLEVKSTVLYTRFDYHMSSPTASEHATGMLKRLARAGLTEQERASIAFAVNSTEKVVAKALLGIRCIREVFITGRGRLEGQFAEVLKATLVQPPGTEITSPSGNPVPNSSGRLYGEGFFASEAYTRKMTKPYKMLVATNNYDFTGLKTKERFFIDDQKDLTEHCLGRSPMEATLLAAVPKAKERRDIREFAVDEDPFGAEAARGTGSLETTRQTTRSTEPELGLTNIVAIHVPKVDKRLMQIFPSEAGDVVMGWRIR
jgi:hypothetical protein